LLRSRADAETILAQAERSSRVIVLGAGFIGMEVAAALRERGLGVTMIGRERVPFEKHLSAEIGAVFVDLHREQGVDFRLGAEITGIKQVENGLAVTFGSGESLSADVVVLGFGVRPATGFAASLPRNEDGSLTVDAHLGVTDGIYAAGDIARFPLHGSGHPIRVEHWRVAQQQGRIAALNMLGRQLAYDATPVFWTIQYMKRLDYIGHAREWDRVVVHGDLRQRDFLAYYIKNGLVAAAAGFGRDRETAALVALMDKTRAWRPEELGSSPATLLQTLHHH
jgi:NADPH-dependent 2,4-dienoyl-CoA reductase/sulfur reductase-like enzyme